MSDRLLKESDVLKIAFQLPYVVNSVFFDAVKALPSVDRPQKIIAQITFDEEKLREIVKEAVERFKEEYEVTDKPQGEWIMSKPEEDGFGAVFQCSRCSCEVDCIPTNFCPNCGAKMGYKDETNRPNRG